MIQEAENLRALKRYRIVLTEAGHSALNHQTLIDLALSTVVEYRNHSHPNTTQLTTPTAPAAAKPAASGLQPSLRTRPNSVPSPIAAVAAVKIHPATPSLRAKNVCHAARSKISNASPTLRTPAIAT